MGQCFIPMFNGANLTNVQVYGYQASASGNITCSIRGFDGIYGSTGVPNATTYATSTQVSLNAPFPTAYAVVNFSFPTGYVFDSSQKYFVTVEGVSGDVNGIYLGIDTTTPVSHLGNFASFASNVWTPSSGTDFLFIIYGDGGDVVSVSLGGTITINEITEVTNVTSAPTVEVTVDGVTAAFNNTEVTASGDITAGAVTAGDVTASGNVTVTGDISVSGGGTSTNDIYTWIIFLIICLNIGVGLLSKGYVLPATVGMVTISIAVAALFTADYAKIIFSPWLQLIALLVGIFGLWGAYHKNKVTG